MSTRWLIIILLLGGGFVVVGQYVDTKIPTNVNPLAVQTVSEMRRVQTMMEIYMTEYGEYPTIGASCQDGEVLSKFLVPDYLDFYPTSLKGRMSVSVSLDGFEYVLHTKLSSASQVLLSRDEDGIVLGCDCNDPNFCFVEYREDPERLRELYGEEL